MKCHYISKQLERIQEANVGAEKRLSSGGPTGFEEQLQTRPYLRFEMRCGGKREWPGYSCPRRGDRRLGKMTPVKRRSHCA